MDYVKIDGVSYDVLTVSLKESFTILYSANSGRSVAEGARMILDPLGTFYGHTVVFARRPGKEKLFDDLFDFLATPRYDGFEVDLAHGQKTIKYEAYTSQGARELNFVDKETGAVYWDALEVNFIPMEAQVKPE